MTNDHPSHAAEFRRIQGDARATRVSFLFTEIEVGLTLLDTAATSRIPGTQARTRALAREAYDEVARHLAGDARLTLSPEERAEIARLHAHLGERLGARLAGDE